MAISEWDDFLIKLLCVCALCDDVHNLLDFTNSQMHVVVAAVDVSMVFVDCDPSAECLSLSLA